MKKFFLSLLIMVLALVGSAVAVLWYAAETAPDAQTPRDVRIVDTDFGPAIQVAGVLVDHAYEDYHLPSLSVAVGVDGRLVWAQANGYAEVAGGVPATVNSKYRIGSVSKSFTAAAVGRLVEEGDLDLDAVYQTYVPDFPRKEYDFTVRQLSGHLAGIRHYREGLLNTMNETFHQVQYANVREAIRLVEDDPLAFEPGQAFLYSSYGYNLISAAIEAASGEDFLSYMRFRVFQPLKMNHTSPDYQDREVADVVGFYFLADDVLIRAPDVNNSYKWAGGGFLSTPSDMVAFGNGLLDNKLLSAQTTALLWTPQKLANGEDNPQRYGMGFRIHNSENGQVYVSHGGSSVGGTTYLLILPLARVVVAVTSNITPLQTDFVDSALSLALAEAFLPEALPLTLDQP
ncbi:MAG: serine hydrolase [Proteobacteria bacterium]|nr:serine hydrolase [Pseudomonadota bacterium]